MFNLYDKHEPRYTIQLRDVIEKGYDIFAFDYDLQEPFKSDFEALFKRYYQFREIGFETVERFLYHLKTEVLIKWKHFEKLFDAYAEDIEVMRTRQTTEDGSEAKHGEKERDFERDSDNDRRSIYADTPNQRLTEGQEIDIASAITDDKTKGLMTDTEKAKEDATTATARNAKGYENITEIELLEKYHDKLKDIMQQFVESFADLFMKVY